MADARPKTHAGSHAPSKKACVSSEGNGPDRSCGERHVQNTSPVSVNYEITDFGKTALGFLNELHKWSDTLPNNEQT